MTDQPEPQTSKPWPYCQQPECHDRHTRVYADGGVTGTASTDWYRIRPPKLIFWKGVGYGLPGERRWCRIHALMFERAW